MAENGPNRGSWSLRALELLEALVSMDRPISIFEITRETGLPKATAHRLCVLLESEGFIAPEIGGKALVFGHWTRDMALGVMTSVVSILTAIKSSWKSRAILARPAI